MVKVTLVVIDEDHEPKPDCLAGYLSRTVTKLQNSLPAKMVEDQEKVLRERVANLSSQLDEFYETDIKTKSWLVLGKVQSGKTSHLLGILSYAAGKKVALASLFTGINGPLNNQTMNRIRQDLPESCVHVFDVPTSHTSAAFTDLFRDVSYLVSRRLSASHNELAQQPMPVMVTMKNKFRISTLKVLISKLSEEFGESFTHLIIDDEADQASQNGAANRSDVTATYEALANLRELPARHAMLSYTATPQAIFLSERDGAVRPDLCVTVPPKIGYFGLDEFTSESYSGNLQVVDDFIEPASKQKQVPNSLINCLVDFFLRAALRANYPSVFYQDSYKPSEFSSRMKSTQLLLHESSTVKNHSALFALVESALKQIGEDCRYGTKNLIEERWAHLLTLVDPLLRVLPENVTDELLDEFVKLLTNTKKIVVNRDGNTPTPNEIFPVLDSEWELHDTWIVIGGDILGRGLTIPQLVGSYFLRSSKTPNFDTVSQQMRFCGYRKDYAKSTYIYALEKTIETFKYMQKIEGAVWRFATKWDKHRQSLTGKIPPIMYAAPLSAKLEPTRKNVRDPNLRDIKSYESDTILYSSRFTFNPSHAFQNIEYLREWFAHVKHDCELKQVSEWTLLREYKNRDLQALIKGFITGDASRSQLRAISELFEDVLGELGLTDRPSAVYIKTSLLTSPKVFADPKNYWLENSIFRGMHVMSDQPNLDTWVTHFNQMGNSKVWGSLKSPHVGETQRGLVRQLEDDATVVMIEPVVGTASKDARTATSFGLAFTIFKPTNWEIRMIGHG